MRVSRLNSNRPAYAVPHQPLFALPLPSTHLCQDRLAQITTCNQTTNAIVTRLITLLLPGCFCPPERAPQTNTTICALACPSTLPRPLCIDEGLNQTTNPIYQTASVGGNTCLKSHLRVTQPGVVLLALSASPLGVRC